VHVLLTENTAGCLQSCAVLECF